MTPLSYLEEIDFNQPGVVEQYDELPLWSAPFGLMLLDRVPLKPGMVVLDVGAGTGFLTVELAQRCGPTARVVAVDPWKPAMDRLRGKLGYLGLTNVDLQERDAAALDLPGESVDLEIRHYGESEGRLELYDDDGVSFAYERGELSWTPLVVRRDATGTLQGVVERPGAGKPFGYREVRWRMMPAR